MVGEQLDLNLPFRVARGRAAFFVADPNRLALATLDDWRNWPGARLALVGPAGAGKTHLADLWAEETGGIGIDAAAPLPDPAPFAGARVAVENYAACAGDPEAERWLLHLHNHVTGTGGRLLLTGRIPPARWPVALPDLASRLRAIPTARLEAPDDTLLAAVMAKLLEDRGLTVKPDLVPYCLARMERSFAAARALVARLDARALATGRPAGKRLAAEVLAEAADHLHDAAAGLDESGDNGQ
jgi:chromosomal replication initiation ATPase DnaA